MAATAIPACLMNFLRDAPVASIIIVAVDFTDFQKWFYKYLNFRFSTPIYFSLKKSY